MNPPLDQLTAQGYDLQFGTNVIGHYILSLLLLPALKRAVATTGTKARIVHTSSFNHAQAPSPDGLELDAYKGGDKRDAIFKKWGASSAPWK